MAQVPKLTGTHSLNVDSRQEHAALVEVVMIKAVIFDLYETLITEFNPDFEPPERSLAERLGIPEGEFQDRFDRLNDEWEIGQISGFRELLARLCDESGHVVPVSVLDDLIRERSQVRVGFFNIEPAVLEMVREIRSMGLRVGLVTNVANLDFAGWPNCDLAPLIEHVATSFAVGVMKPDPVIYERCLEELGVEAGETAYVGDGGSDELIGAERVGMTPFWATWYLDRWPYGIGPRARFAGGETRQFDEHEPPYPRMKSPSDLVDWLQPRR